MSTFTELLTESLKQQDIVCILNFPDVLLESYEKDYIRWISEYSINYGACPDLKRFRKEFSLFVPDECTDPLVDIYDTTLSKRRNLYTRRKLEEHQEELREGVDPTELIREIYNNIMQGDSDVLFYSTFDRNEYFKEVKHIYFGIEFLDHVTGGLQSGDLCYIMGRLGSGKTTLALWIVSNWLLAGLKILVIPNETTSRSVIGKIDAALAGFNPAKLRTRKWDKDEIARINALSSLLPSADGEIVLSKKPISNPAQVDALIKKYNPDVCLIDGSYLMGKETNGGATWERVSNVSRSLKTIAMENEIPIMGVHQSTRNSKSKDEIEAEDAAYSDAVGQDADILIGVNHKDQDGKILINTPKNRDNKTVNFYIKFFFEKFMVKVYGV